MSLEKWIDTLPVTSQRNPSRAQALAFLREHGFPKKTHPDWKFSGLKKFIESDYALAAEDASSLTHEQLAKCKEFLSAEFHNLVFVDGVLNTTLSDADELPNSVSFSDESVASSDVIDGFDALNLAAAQGEVVLRVDASAQLERPVHLCFITTDSASHGRVTAPRLRIDIGEDAQISLIESYFSLGTAAHLVNPLNSVKVASKARVHHVLFEGLPSGSAFIGRSRFDLAEKAELLTLVCGSGASYGRHRLDIPLSATGTQLRSLGLSLLTGDEVFENHTNIDHKVGGCQTEQRYKSILAGESRSVFSGKILIRPGAQQTNSSQLNQNLLLSEKGEAVTQPQLMIEADDVKATHGATVGQLSEEELFYLRSRGISRSQAISMLAEGFMVEIIQEIPVESIRAWLKARTQDRLAALSKEVQ